MLPGFRFVLATVVLAVSVLIFGLGAAALLRASHDRFASLPTAQAPPEQLPNRDQEQRQTTLALLRVEMMTEQAQTPSQPQAVIEAAKAPVVDEPQPIPGPVDTAPAAGASVEPQAALAPAIDETASPAESAAVATPAPQAPIAAPPVTALPATASAEAAPVAAAPTAADPVADKKDSENEKTAASAAPVGNTACVPAAAAAAQTGPQLAMQIDQPPPRADVVQPAAPAALATPTQIVGRAKRVVHSIHRIRIHHAVVSHKHRRHVIRAAHAQYARAQVARAQIAARMGQAPQQPDPFSGYPARTVAPR